MDEPLSNLDAKLRVSTRTQIASLQRRLGITTVYVTHDQVEAMTMGDRVAVMKLGVLQQAGAPSDMYDRPANLFVAGFIGSPAMNLLPLPLGEDGVLFGTAAVRLQRESLEAARAGGVDGVMFGVRPEDLRLVPGGEGLDVVVEVVEELGADAFVYGQATVDGEPHDLVVRVPGRRTPKKGEVLRVAPDPERVHLFHQDSGLRLPDAVPAV